MNRSFNTLYQSLRFSGLDTSGNPRDPKAADFAFRGSLILSFILFIGYILQTIFLIVIARGGDDLQRIAWLSAPLFAKAILIFSLVCGLLLNPLIFVAVIRGNREAAGAAFYFSLLTVGLNLFCFVLLQMRGNGIVVIPSQGSATLNTFTVDTQTVIVQFAMDNPQKWDALQKSEELGDCCGLNIESVYADELFGIKNFDEDVLLSNDQCAIGRGTIDTIKTTFQNFDPQVIELADSDDILGDPNFFCERAMAQEIKGLAQKASIVFGVEIFLQVFCSFFLGQLIYTYGESEGGLKPDEESLEARPKVENTVLVKAGYEPGFGKTASGSYNPKTMPHKKIKF